MGVPPSLRGARKETLALPAPATAATAAGAPATVRGVTSCATEGAPTPAAFFADTLHEYAVPFINPLTVAVLSVATTFLILTTAPAVQVTTKLVIGAPPSKAGLIQSTRPFLLNAVTPGDVGASGVVRGVTVFGAVAGPAPASLYAVTVHEYSTPFANPLTTHGLTAVKSVTAAWPLAEHAVEYPVGMDAAFDDGAVQRSVADVFPVVTTNDRGTAGMLAAGGGGGNNGGTR